MEEKIIHDEHIEECCCGHDHDHEHEHEHHHDHDHNHEHHHHHHHDHDEECCCGHDHDHDHEHHHHHHHDHDEECCCGHDHDHEHHHHHHDHDEECCCGQDHDHEHHHHHDHGHTYSVPGFRVFETHNHEGATICSFEKDTKNTAAEAAAAMEACINTLEKWLDENDYMIGHVKGYVKEAGPTTTFSTVGYGLNVEKHDGGAACVGFASIVFGPSEEELMTKVQQVFQEV